MEDTSQKYIELNAFLKVNGIAPTGGQAKTIIHSGTVFVNKAVEIRNRRKLRAGDVVTYKGKNYTVKKEQTLMSAS